MKEFNKERELNKLRLKNNKSKYIKYGSIILSVLILVVGIIYFTFAKFESNKSYTLIEGRIGDYSTGDINIAFNTDGNSSNTMPEKGTGYKYKRAECNDNNVEVTFDKTAWEANVQHVTQKTKCTLYFETVTEVEVTLYGGVNEIVTIDDEIEYTMDSTGKKEGVIISTGEHELKGSISNQTFTVNIDSEDTTVAAMPNNGDGVIYWYGYKDQNFVTVIFNNGNHYQTNPSYTTNYVSMTSRVQYTSGFRTTNTYNSSDYLKAVSMYSAAGSYHTTEFNLSDTKGYIGFANSGSASVPYRYFNHMTTNDIVNNILVWSSDEGYSYSSGSFTMYLYEMYLSN